MRTRILLLIAFFQLATLAFGQKYEMWGITESGGAWDNGTIFKLDSNGNNQQTFYSFPFISISNINQTIKGTNGKLYGVTHNGLGIFEFDLSTNKYDIVLSNFPFHYASLVYDSIGKIYGVKYDYSTNSNGEVFEIDLISKQYVKLADFDTINVGKPDGLIMQASNGRLYGMTSNGGLSNNGTIYEYDISANKLTKVFDFTNSILGSIPSGKLTEATNGKLYGVTIAGGAFNGGTLFSFNLTNYSRSRLMNFSASQGGSYFKEPIQASNGKLYGLTGTGGTSNNGVLYEFDIINNSYSVKFNFGGTNGDNPIGSLIEMGNGLLYGTTNRGGIAGLGTTNGVLFEYNITTSTYAKKIDFFTNNLVRIPFNSLIKISPTEIIGFAAKVLNQFSGEALFKYDYLADKFSIVTKLDDYYFGGKPTNIIELPNGLILCTTSYGGLHDQGVFFTIDQLSGKVQIVHNKYNFDNIGLSYSNLVLTDKQKIIGVSKKILAGTTVESNIYEFNLDSFKVVHTFPRNINIGSQIFNHSNGLIYGVSSNNNGYNLFYYDPQLRTVQTVMSLSQIDGEVRFCEGANGMIYGVSSAGGSFNGGLLFSIDLTTNSYSILHNFNAGPGSGSGYRPRTTPIIASNSKLYGMTEYNGFYGDGALYEFNFLTNTYSRILTFGTGSNDGEDPKESGLFELNNGKLYGYTKEGGSAYVGTFFEYSILTNTFIKKSDFGGLNGKYPVGSLLKISDCILQRDTLNVSACYQYTSPSGKFSWSNTGIYSDTINLSGCDSVYKINLTVNKVNNTVVTFGSNTIASNAFQATYQWLDCNNNYAIIPNETGQLFNAASTGNYAVEVTSTVNGCVDTSACYPITLVGFDELEFGESLTIFPNPTKNNVTISFGSNQSSFSSQVYNIHGKLINESNHASVKQIKLNLGESEGVYFIHLVSNNGERVIRKVVKQ